MPARPGLARPLDPGVDVGAPAGELPLGRNRPDSGGLVPAGRPLIHVRPEAALSRIGAGPTAGQRCARRSFAPISAPPTEAHAQPDRGRRAPAAAGGWSLAGKAPDPKGNRLAAVCGCRVVAVGRLPRQGPEPSPRPSPPGEISAPHPSPPRAPGFARVTIIVVDQRVTLLTYLAQA